VSDDIRPALTPEEWAEILAAPRVWRSEAERIAFEAGRHAQAALCLHGQPFGFTHEDVKFLRDVVAPDWYAGDGGGAARQAARMQERWESILARIAALLPHQRDAA
jgi:hypothetical protein